MSEIKKKVTPDLQPKVFDELLESFDKGGFDGVKLKGPKISSQKAENFELLGLLEYEYERLHKTNTFLNTKLTRNEDFELMTKLLAQQENIIISKKEKLALELISKDSPLMQSMKDIFQRSFKLNSTLK